MPLYGKPDIDASIIQSIPQYVSERSKSHIKEYDSETGEATVRQAGDGLANRVIEGFASSSLASQVRRKRISHRVSGLPNTGRHG
jgi:hypothetical protein